MQLRELPDELLPDPHCHALGGRVLQPLDLVEDIEIALLKLEIKDTVAKLGGGIGMFAGALFLGLFGLAFLFVTIVLGLVALGVPAWVSTLIVTVVLLGGAATLAVMGKKKFAAVQFVPTASIENIKTDIETIKGDIARARSRA